VALGRGVVLYLWSTFGVALTWKCCLIYVHAFVFKQSQITHAFDTIYALLKGGGYTSS
jgi:hypothetical protein